MTIATRVLVTGGTGFIGSHVVRQLLDSGRDVAVLTRSGGSVDRLGRIPDTVALVRADLTDSNSVRRAVSEWRPEACIHLAWFAEPGQYLQSLENLSALSSTLTLLQELADVGCTRIAMAGTCAEYDSSRGWLREDSPTDPQTLYAATKLSAALITQELARIKSLQLAWGRVFYPYGPGEDERRAVPAAIRSLLAGIPFDTTLGAQVRDYMHVGDVASAFVALVDAPASGVYNISAGVPVTMRQVMELIGEIIGCVRLIRFGATAYRKWDPMFICGDNSRLKSLGWTPRMSLKDGLQETAAWWRKQGKVSHRMFSGGGGQNVRL